MNGCALVKYSDQIEVLKEIGRNQGEIQDYLNRQEELFELLLEDIENENLEEGVSKQYVLKKYGEPIYSKDIENTEKFLYRHPVEYFSCEKVYLYFNDSGKLEHWEHVPFSE